MFLTRRLLLLVRFLAGLASGALAARSRVMPGALGPRSRVALAAVSVRSRANSFVAGIAGVGSATEIGEKRGGREMDEGSTSPVAACGKRRRLSSVSTDAPTTPSSDVFVTPRLSPVPSPALSGSSPAFGSSPSFGGSPALSSLPQPPQPDPPGVPFRRGPQMTLPFVIFASQSRASFSRAGCLIVVIRLRIQKKI